LILRVLGIFQILSKSWNSVQVFFNNLELILGGKESIENFER
jgi:hypothetical protein